MLIVLLAVANAVLGMALGLFSSAYARTEFQAVQFMPALILPLLCGLLVPRDQMAEWLQWIAALMPFTYAYDALSRAATESALDARFWLDVAVVVGVTVLALALGAATLRAPYALSRRRTVPVPCRDAESVAIAPQGEATSP